MLQQCTWQSPLGGLTLVGDEQALWGSWFDGQAYFGSSFDLASIPEGEPEGLQAAKRWLAAYFAGRLAPLPPVHYSGTPYRQAVQQALTTIPLGQTTTYTALAAKVATQLGRQPSPRAVGGAVGHNPLSVIVPCHRVIGADGSLVGYAGGLERKRALLALEQKMLIR